MEFFTPGVPTEKKQLCSPSREVPSFTLGSCSCYQVLLLTSLRTCPHPPTQAALMAPKHPDLSFSTTFLRKGLGTMLPKMLHASVPEVPPEILGKYFHHPFLIAAHCNAILWKYLTTFLRFFRPKEDSDIKLSVDSFI